MKISGVVHTSFPEERYGDFVKKVVWLRELNVPHPNHYAVEFWHDDTIAAAQLKSGDAIVCEIEPRGRLIKKRNTNEEYVINIFLCKGFSRL